MITNHESGTRIDEVTAGIYRISTPMDVIPGGFTFNSYLAEVRHGTAEFCDF